MTYHAKINIHKDDLVYSLRTPTVIDPCDVNAHIISYIDMVVDGNTHDLSVACLKDMYDSELNEYHSGTYQGVKIDIGLFTTNHKGGAL